MGFESNEGETPIEQTADPSGEHHEPTPPVTPGTEQSAPPSKILGKKGMSAMQGGFGATPHTTATTVTKAPETPEKK